MPASPYNVLINLAGSVNPSVNLSISRVTRQLRGLQTQAIATNRSLAGMGRGLGAIMGIGGGLLAIGGLTAGMNEAIKLSKENEQIQEATLVILKNQRLLRQQNVELAGKDLEVLNAQAKALQQQTGIYKNIFERGSFILAQTHRTPQEIERINASMANLLAAQRMQGKNVESLPELYQAVGKAIETGMARNLNSVGVILTPMEKQLLMMHAKMRDFGANIKIVLAAIDRTYGGMAAVRMRTLTGQTERALANVRSAMESMGDALKPVQQRLTIIFGEILPLIVPLVIRIANDVNAALREHIKDIQDWVSYMKRYVIPVMLTWIDKGWKVLIESIKYLKGDGNWILTFLAAWAAGIVAVRAATVLLTTAQWALDIAMFVNPLESWLVIIPLVIGGIALLIMNFDKVKKSLMGMKDWLFGTDAFGGREKRLFQTGNIYKKQYQVGFLPELGKNIKSWLETTGQQWDKAVLEWLENLRKQVGEWIDNLGQSWDAAFIKWGQDFIKFFSDPIVEGMKVIGKAFTDWLLDPLKKWGDMWQEFLQHLPFGAGPASTNVSTGAQGVVALPGGRTKGVWNPMTAAPIPPGLISYSGNLQEQRAQLAAQLNDSEVRRKVIASIVAEQGTTNTAAMLGYTESIMNRALARNRSLYSIVSDPNYYPEATKSQLSKTYSPEIQRRVNDLIDKALAGSNIAKFATGNESAGVRDFIRRNAVTFAPPGGERFGIEKGTESWVARTARAKAIASTTTSEAPAITLNYNVTHHHDGMDLAGVEGVHRRHADALSRIMEDAIYQNNRKSFDSGSEAL